MSKHIRIQEAIDNADANINYLATLPDDILSKKLDTIHLQMELAEQKRNTNSLELLEVWRAQIIEARILKAENNIPDAPNEIELANADIETFIVKSEERQEVLTQAIKQPSPKVQQQQDNDSQLSLF